MQKLKSYEIRQRWLDFWKSKGHDVIESASLIPQNDPTLLWINAGVAPLKKYFDGREVPSNKRMTNAQKSIRTNDIENVGKTARHHTFFEMLGNFSIGDYFREEVLQWATEVLFMPEWFGLDQDKVYITYYPDDKETYKRWIEVGIKPDHLIPCKGNFWEIGEGPCGPDTEFFFDRGEKYDPEGLGTRLISEDIENDRYIEIWNIVFSQFNSKIGVPRSEYKELPSKNIDTGMGLERVACIMQGAETNYETDLFLPIIEEVEKVSGVKYCGQMAFKVIADHVRSVVFALSDGASFSNEGRGYVLRRILRRAVRYSKKLGINRPFFFELVDVVVDNMKVFYPYLVDKAESVKKQIRLEEEKFLATLSTGEKKLNDYMATSSSKIVSKEVAFLLYDTFGFPIELTIEAAEDNNFSVDLDGFKELLEKQRQRARNARKKDQSMNVQNADILAFKEPYEFIGYSILENDTKVTGIFKDGKIVSSGNGIVIVTVSKSGFYAESGGQNGDIGRLILNGKAYLVTDTLKLANGQAGLVCDMDNDTICVGDDVHLEVDDDFRIATAKNHSATHLLNQALRNVVGSHIFQQGSSVTSEELHFDFNNFDPLTNEQILEVERIVNQEILKAHDVCISNLEIEEAKKLGAQMVFGEKYGKVVRVVDMGFSKEFCGGTHVTNTSVIDSFAILSVSTKGSGIFRVTATTSSSIIPEIKATIANIEADILQVQTKIDGLLAKAKENNIKIDYKPIEISSVVPSYKTIINRRNELEMLKERAKEIDKEVSKAISASQTLSTSKYTSMLEDVNGTKVLVLKVSSSNINAYKELADNMANEEGNVVLLFALVSDKVVFIAKSTNSSVNAGNIVKVAATICEGNGGGRPDFAQAGGKNIEKVDEALESAKKIIKESL